MKFKTVNLGRLTRIRTGKLDANASSEDGQYPFFTCSKTPLRISSYSYNCECVLIAGNGDLNVKYFEGKFDAYQRTYIVDIPQERRTDLSLRYAYYFLETYLETLREQSIGGIIKYIKMGNLTEAKIPLPPLAEQKRIAGILDAADALRAKRRAALAQLDKLAQSLFLDRFGDPVTNPMGWEVIPFHRVGTFVSGATPKKDRADFWEGDVPWVSPKDMKRDFIGESIDTISEKAVKETNIKIIEKGHLLIVVRGMILAHSFPVAINTCAVTFNQDMKAIKPSQDYDPQFLLNCFKNAKRAILAVISEAGHGTKKFDQKAMESISLPKPPLPLQQSFATAIESIERQKARHREQLTGLDTLFGSLQHRAFRGEL